MIIELDDLLSADDVAGFNTALEGQLFVDGRETALNEARQVKNNVQLQADSALRAELSQRLEAILLRHTVFTTVVLPKRIGLFHFSRYETDMTYGDHVDNSVMAMGRGNPMRADLSMSVFLNDPADYDGGELMLNTKTTPRAVKLKAGAAVIYPTNEFHRVEPVTRGVRKVAIGWIESLVRGTARRQVVTDMWQALDGIAKLSAPDELHENQAYQTLNKARWGVLRLWAET